MLKWYAGPECVSYLYDSLSLYAFQLLTGEQYTDTGAIWKVHANLFLVRKAFTWALLKMQHKIWLIRIERHAKDHQSLLLLAHKHIHVPRRTNCAETFNQAFLIYEVKRGGKEHALCIW